jgi:hypothetical protein
MTQVESEVLVRSTSTVYPEFCTEIALRGYGLEAPANIGRRSLVGRLPCGERGPDCLLANR